MHRMNSADCGQFSQTRREQVRLFQRLTHAA
jgi:hypothetical protein